MQGHPLWSARTRGLLLGGYVAATFLSFPHPVAGRVLDLGAVVSWLGPALLLLGIDGLDWKRAGRAALVAGLAAHTAVMHWIYVVTVTYGHAPALLGIVAPMALALYVAAFTGVFGAIWGRLCQHRLAGVWTAALLWTAVDHARSFVLTGFPWATLGYAQHENTALLGLASATGVYGLSFTTALGGAALAAVARAWMRGGVAGLLPSRSVWAALAVVAALHAVGLGLRRPIPEDAPTVRVAAIQGNIDQDVKWSPEWRDETVTIYEQLTRRAVREGGAQIVVWPESAVPGHAGSDPALRARLARLGRETGVSLVVGAVGLDTDAQGERLFFDSAFFIDPDGTFTDRYDKSHLVPFGEYVPLRGLLGSVLGAVARGMARTDVSAGLGPRAVEVPTPGAPGGPVVRAGVPICYELLFPDLVRRFVGDGAEVLFAITNDAWYGRTGAPYQFLAITALRSAETGVWTVRAANTGISAIIDATGEVREQTPIFERHWIAADVPLRRPADGSTLYVRFGDVFAWSCWAALVIRTLPAIRRMRGRTNPPDEKR
ncbi:MAG: apolipoprotein N-acyltransferase [Proteobacteria bacterium]|nr:apolipoprotein N-acyltransferase [Pseudomonadota bacterium]